MYARRTLCTVRSAHGAARSENCTVRSAHCALAEKLEYVNSSFSDYPVRRARATRCSTSKSLPRSTSSSTFGARRSPRRAATAFEPPTPVHPVHRARVRASRTSTTTTPAASTCARSGRSTRPSCRFTMASTWPRWAARRRLLPTWSRSFRLICSNNI